MTDKSPPVPNRSVPAGIFLRGQGDEDIIILGFRVKTLLTHICT